MPSKPGQIHTDKDPFQNDPTKNDLEAAFKHDLFAALCFMLFLIGGLLQILGDVLLAPFRLLTGRLKEKPIVTCLQTERNRAIIEACPSMALFSPTWWAAGPYAQTVAAGMSKAPPTRYRNELVLLPDKVQVLLQWKDGGLPPDAPLVLICHGIGGCGAALSVQIFTDECNRNGFRAVVYNRRGHSGISLLPVTQSKAATLAANGAATNRDRTTDASINVTMPPDGHLPDKEHGANPTAQAPAQPTGNGSQLTNNFLAGPAAFLAGAPAAAVGGVAGATVGLASAAASGTAHTAAAFAFPNLARPSMGDANGPNTVPASGAAAAAAAAEDATAGNQHIPPAKIFPRHWDFEDMEAVVKHVVRLFPNAPKFLVGYSAGANVVCNYQAVKGEATPFQAAVSASNGFSVNEGLSILFSRSFVINGIVSFFVKDLLYSGRLEEAKQLAAQQGKNINFDAIKKVRKLEDLEATIVVPAYNYNSLSEYYYDMSSDWRLKDVRRPLLCLSNADDPLVDKTMPLRHAVTAATTNENIFTVLTRRGGHVGWLQGSKATPWVTGLFFEFYRAVMATQGLRPPPPVPTDTPMAAAAPAAAAPDTSGPLEMARAPTQVAAMLAERAGVPPDSVFVVVDPKAERPNGHVTEEALDAPVQVKLWAKAPPQQAMQQAAHIVAECHAEGDPAAGSAPEQNAEYAVQVLHGEAPADMTKLSATQQRQQQRQQLTPADLADVPNSSAPDTASTLAGGRPVPEAQTIAVSKETHAGMEHCLKDHGFPLANNVQF